MHIQYLRDVPFALGILALLVGIFRNGFEVRISPDPDCPQWFCRAMFLVVGTLLICFGIIGNFYPS
jgi:uncharacterized membrane protein YczE